MHCIRWTPPPGEHEPDDRVMVGARRAEHELAQQRVVEVRQLQQLVVRHEAKSSNIGTIPSTMIADRFPATKASPMSQSGCAALV